MAQNCPTHKVELSNKTTLTFNVFKGSVYGHSRDLKRNKSVTLNLDELWNLAGCLATAIVDATVLLTEESDETLGNGDNAGQSAGPSGPRGGGAGGAAAALIAGELPLNRKRHAPSGVATKKTPAGSSPVLWEDGVDQDAVPMAPVRRKGISRRALIRKPSATNLKRVLFNRANEVEDVLNASQARPEDDDLLNDGEDEYYLNMEC